LQFSIIKGFFFNFEELYINFISKGEGILMIYFPAVELSMYFEKKISPKKSSELVKEYNVNSLQYEKEGEFFYE